MRTTIHRVVNLADPRLLPWIVLARETVFEIQVDVLRRQRGRQVVQRNRVCNATCAHAPDFHFAAPQGPPCKMHTPPRARAREKLQELSILMERSMCWRPWRQRLHRRVSPVQLPLLLLRLCLPRSQPRLQPHRTREDNGVRYKSYIRLEPHVHERASNTIMQDLSLPR